MRRAIYAAFFVSLALALPSPAAAQVADSKPDLGANAAMKYWQAFARLPNLDKDQEKLLEDWSKVPLEGTALRLLERSEGSRTYLHRGAMLPRCDWSLDYEDGILLVLPHLAKSMTLARLVALDARHEFEQGHWKAGWEDVTGLLRLARHVEVTPIMIANLVGYRIETFAIEAAAPYLPQLKSVLPAAASTALDRLPVGATLQELVLKEKEIGAVWLIGELKQAEQKKKGSWKVVWDQVLLAGVEELENQNREAVESAKTSDQAISLLEGLIPLNDQLAKVAALPWKEFDARYPEFVRDKAPNPLAGFFLPSMDRYVAAQRRNQAQMALFKAAIAIVQGGIDSIKLVKDPFGDGPFEYRALDQGFELKSKLLFKDQPVTLTVGKGSKE